MSHTIVTVNAGSSSVKVAIFQQNPSGQLERFAFKNFQNIGADGPSHCQMPQVSGQSFVHLVNWLQEHVGLAEIKAIGHRIVHGGLSFYAPVWIDQQVIQRLVDCISLAPNHLPSEIELITQFAQQYPDILQAASFDTAFHYHLPRHAALLPIPRRLQVNRIRRFGFHGISYEYLMSELDRIGGDEVANGRVILAHLGNGASMAAVCDGKCIDTSMSLTPTAGLMMGTRTGDIDPGLLFYLMRERGMTSAELDQMVTQESGLLGLSETTFDMRELLRNRKTDLRADDAISVFCYQAKKQIGAYYAALGGLDTLVFSGGIGERSPDIRKEICHELDALGIQLDEDKNSSAAEIISTPDSGVTVRVIETNEELMLAKDVIRLMQH